MTTTRTARTHQRVGGIAAAAALAIGLAACSGGDDESLPDGVADADVTFAQEMIPHHAQAVEMADLVDDRSDDPQVQQLADAIAGAQQPEIDTMTGWLEDWGADVPSTDPMAGMDEGMDMDGMMSADDMSSLEDATGARFDRLWLQLMIEHHEGAIEMAQTEQSDGEDADAIALAEQIESSQSDEIARMEQMLTP